MVEITLENSLGSSTFSTLSPPVATSFVEGARDVQTLDNNISTYFTANKREWRHTWSEMTDVELAVLLSYYNQQWIDFEYPLLTIEFLELFDVPVRMYMDTQNLIDNCGTYEGVSVTFRETDQNETES